MSNELLGILISFAGVLISVAVSVFISLRATSIELQKLRADIQQEYMGKLLDKRIEIYPILYCLLSDFAKKSWLNTFSKDDIIALYNAANQWHSENSILFSAQTNVVSYRFFGELKELTEQEPSADRIHSFVSGILAEFELALKSDLGIYIVDFSDPTKRFHTYADLVDAVSKQNK